MLIKLLCKVAHLVGQFRCTAYTIMQKLELSRRGDSSTANLVHPECHTSYKHAGAGNRHLINFKAR